MIPAYFIFLVYQYWRFQKILLDFEPRFLLNQELTKIVVRNFYGCVSTQYFTYLTSV